MIPGSLPPWQMIFMIPDRMPSFNITPMHAVYPLIADMYDSPSQEQHEYHQVPQVKNQEQQTG